MFQSHLDSKQFVRDPVTLWAPRPSMAPFNSLGYRGRELPERKEPGEFRILAVGDSNTLGNKRISWVGELAGSFAAQRPGAGEVTVINAGAYGYASFQGKHHLRRFIKYHPDVVLISFGGNDATPNVVGDKNYVAYQPAPVYLWFDRKSAIVNAIEYLSVKWSEPQTLPEPAAAPEELVSRVSLDDYERNLEEMIELAESAGAVPVVLTRPVVFNYHAEESTSSMKAYYHKTREVAQALSVGLIDVDEMANHSWALFDDHSHFNDRGHRLIGSYVATALGDLLGGRDYDRETLKFRASNADDRATDAVRKIFSSWATLEQNLERLKAGRPEISPASSYESSFESDADGWRTWMLPSRLKDKPPEARDGALCFSGEPARNPTQATLEREALELAEDLPHLLWVDAQSSSDFSTRIFWRAAGDSDFAEESSVSDAFYDEGGAPSRFFHVLPAGTSAIRLRLYTIQWRDAICLARIKIMSLSISEEGGGS